MSVDCTDCPFQQILIEHPTEEGKKIINKNLYSFKFKGPGLRYELAVSLLNDDIVWLSGPHLPGMKNDLQIFRSGLLHMLEPGERCEADKIYLGDAPKFIKCPGMVGIHDDDRGKRVEARHETVNKRLKIFSCVANRYKGKQTTPAGKIRDHGNMFTAVVVITQVSMELGYRNLMQL